MEAIQLPTGEWSLVETHQGAYQTKEKARLAAEQILAERAQLELVLTDALRRLPHEQLVDIWRCAFGQVSVNTETVASGDELIQASDAHPVAERGEADPPSNHKSELSAVNLMPENETQYPPDTLMVTEVIFAKPISQKDVGQFTIHYASWVQLPRGTLLKKVGNERGFEIWKAFTQVEGYEYLGTKCHCYGDNAARMEEASRISSAPRAVMYENGKAQPWGMIIQSDRNKPSMDDLASYLNSLKPGPVENTTQLELLLAETWDDMGGDESGMAGQKLIGRMEDVEWYPPVLSFLIERHGGTVLGSTRAVVQQWKVDLDLQRATYECTGHRQLPPMARPVDVDSIADEIADRIVGHKPDNRLNWLGNGRFRVELCEIFPDNSGIKQTVYGRRKLLLEALIERLSPIGWTHLGKNTFGRLTTQGS